MAVWGRVRGRGSCLFLPGNPAARSANPGTHLFVRKRLDAGDVLQPVIQPGVHLAHHAGVRQTHHPGERLRVAGTLLCPHHPVEVRLEELAGEVAGT